MTRDRPQAILFDWDNTLVDSWDVIHAALNDTLLAMGHKPWTLDETRAWVRGSMRDAFPDLFGERWREASEIFYDGYAARCLTVRALPGAAAVLERLASAGVYLGVVSSKDGDYLRAEARRLGLDRYFGRLVGATDTAEDKPSPLTVLAALEGSGIVPGLGVWFVGDTAIDMVCARNAGCIAIFLGNGEGEGPGGGDRPDHRFTDLEAFADFVQGIV